jgi:hypothetical protein
MNGRLAPSTKALLEAAKGDGPGAAAKARVWSRVAQATGGAGAPTSTPSGHAGAGGAHLPGGLTLFGGAMTVGLTAFLLSFGWAPRAPSAGVVAAAPAGVPARHAEPARTSLPPDPAAVPAFEGTAVGEASTLATGAAEKSPTLTTVTAEKAATVTTVTADTAANVAILDADKAQNAGTAQTGFERSRVPEQGRESVPARTLVAAKAAKAATPPAAATVASESDALEREASLVAAARSALLKGDPQRALERIRAARAIPSGVLAPEELALEAQALRASGRMVQADSVEAKLRADYPESALAR